MQERTLAIVLAAERLNQFLKNEINQGFSPHSISRHEEFYVKLREQGCEFQYLWGQLDQAMNAS